MLMFIEKWAGLGSILLLWSVVKNHIPETFRLYLTACATKLTTYFSPYITITIPEYCAERFKRGEFFLAIESYLAHACARRAHKLKAELAKDSKNLQVSVDDHEEVIDEFKGVTLWWYASKQPSKASLISFYPGQEDKRFYQVVFHRQHRDLIVDEYLPFVLTEGRAVTVRNRQRRLFTNNASGSWNSYRQKSVWSHVKFEHPATFDTLAMDTDQKESIISDLMAFQESKEYYTKVGKAWKRGYLLYGPPGTGKSTMIAAMANFLDYDIYDLELTAVKNNTELRKLFIETTGKSIIVIEDIDCSIDLTGKRLKDKKGTKESDDDEKPKLPTDAEKDETSKVTLSGLLNFIDGLWSACGGERIIIFTTNHKEKLDPALIRRGRMDKHIEMSYCRFEGFKVLANNYLDVAEHELFREIRQLLEETDMSPADVAENMMPMSQKKKRDPNVCLAGLVEALKKAKEDAMVATAKEEEEAEAKKAKEKHEEEEAEA
uniref:AAA-ATPase n=1 Tax=Brachypodium sylvaticum TaxID=29664 RepID=C3TX92_BRASY|nr:AAA-ATPase [Brachypodium sylvaticum]